MTWFHATLTGISLRASGMIFWTFFRAYQTPIPRPDQEGRGETESHSGFSLWFWYVSKNGIEKSWESDCQTIVISSLHQSPSTSQCLMIVGEWTEGFEKDSQQDRGNGWLIGISMRCEKHGPIAKDTDEFTLPAWISRERASGSYNEENTKIWLCSLFIGCGW
jgi:hypothetical protein